MSRKNWRTPSSRNLGLFTDLRLFRQALDIAAEYGHVNNVLLAQELPDRVQGLLLVRQISSTTTGHLIRELRQFGWITPSYGTSRPSDYGNYKITNIGMKALNMNKRELLRELTAQMQRIYVIPAWFVDRLWNTNPIRQGEVVIPAPMRDWKPASRLWDDIAWTKELEFQTERSFEQIATVLPEAFPIEFSIWCELVKKAWERAGTARRRVSDRKRYAPRTRLRYAMREAAVKDIIFSNVPPNGQRGDFGTQKPPLLPRTYMGWCPRLETLELIFYTDAHPYIPGRLIFPTSVFRTEADKSRFERIENVKNPRGQNLWLHRPSWDILHESFLQVLWEEHHRASARVGSIYVSLLDVRDEVCRQLRLSAAYFDELLQEALRESVLSSSPWSISVETDIRDDQRGAPNLLRRPVWLDGTPHSLVAVQKRFEVETA